MLTRGAWSILTAAMLMAESWAGYEQLDICTDDPAKQQLSATWCGKTNPFTAIMSYSDAHYPNRNCFGADCYEPQIQPVSYNCKTKDKGSTCSAVTITTSSDSYIMWDWEKTLNASMPPLQRSLAPGQTFDVVPQKYRDWPPADPTYEPLLHTDRPHILFQIAGTITGSFIGNYIYGMGLMSYGTNESRGQPGVVWIPPADQPSPGPVIQVKSLSAISWLQSRRYFVPWVIAYERQLMFWAFGTYWWPPPEQGCTGHHFDGYCGVCARVDLKSSERVVKMELWDSPYDPAVIHLAALVEDKETGAQKLIIGKADSTGVFDGVNTSDPFQGPSYLAMCQGIRFVDWKLQLPRGTRVTDIKLLKHHSNLSASDMFSWSLGGPRIGTLSYNRTLMSLTTETTVSVLLLEDSLRTLNFTDQTILIGYTGLPNVVFNTLSDVPTKHKGVNLPTAIQTHTWVNEIYRRQDTGLFGKGPPPGPQLPSRGPWNMLPAETMWIVVALTMPNRTSIDSDENADFVHKLFVQSMDELGYITLEDMQQLYGGLNTTIIGAAERDDPWLRGPNYQQQQDQLDNCPPYQWRPSRVYACPCASSSAASNNNNDINSSSSNNSNNNSNSDNNETDSYFDCRARFVYTVDSEFPVTSVHSRFRQLPLPLLESVGNPFANKPQALAMECSQELESCNLDFACPAFLECVAKQQKNEVEASSQCMYAPAIMNQTNNIFSKISRRVLEQFMYPVLFVTTEVTNFTYGVLQASTNFYGRVSVLGLQQILCAGQPPPPSNSEVVSEPTISYPDPDSSSNVLTGPAPGARLKLLDDLYFVGRVQDFYASENSLHLQVTVSRARFDIEGMLRLEEICQTLNESGYNNTFLAGYTKGCKRALEATGDLPGPPNVNDFAWYTSSCPPGVYCPSYSGFWMYPSTGEDTITPGLYTRRSNERLECHKGFFCYMGTLQQCPIGYVCPEVEMGKPIKCASSPFLNETCFYANLTQPGLQSKVPCEPGSTCLVAYRPGVPAPPGWAVNTLDRTEFMQCGSGDWCGLGRGTVEGHTEALGAAEGDLNLTHLLCPAGTYCNVSSVLQPTICSFDITTPNTSYCPAGSVAQNPCSAGFFCQDPRGPEQPCYAPQFCPAGSLVPAVCPAGSYCSSPNQSQVCPEGFYCTQGSTSPQRCATLTKCPKGTASYVDSGLYVLLAILVLGVPAAAYFCYSKHQERIRLSLLDQREQDAAQAQEMLQLALSKSASERVASPPANTSTSSSDAEIVTRPQESDFISVKVPQESDFISVKVASETRDQAERKTSNSSGVQEAELRAAAGSSDRDKNGAAEGGEKESKNGNSTTTEEQRGSHGLVPGVLSSAVTPRIYRGKTFLTGALLPLPQAFVPMTFTFKELGLKLKGSGKVVLDGVTGIIHSGRVTAVMGPSGAGKSTFLTALLDKASYGIRMGEVLVNGRPCDLSKLTRLIGFVPQEDVMHREISVKEVIQYNALLRLPPCYTRAQKIARACRVIDILGLTGVEWSPIGDENVRGISGGQRKRVNIGMELACEPTTLILDEPTSGLDSTSSKEVCQALRMIAESGLTVMTVIHQPRYEIFRMFHDVLLLGKGGRTVYLGPSDHALPYFTSLGFKLPTNSNPADFFMDVISGSVPRQDFPDFKREDLFQLWETRHERPPYVQSPSTVAKGQSLDDLVLRKSLKDSPGPSRFTQMCLVAERTLVQTMRDKSWLIFDIILLLLGGLFFGLVYFQVHYIGPSPPPVVASCQQAIGDPTASQMCALPLNDPLPGQGCTCAMALALAAVAAALRIFGDEKAVFYRESSSGLSSLAYFCGKNIGHTPELLLAPFCFLVFYYQLITPKANFGSMYLLFFLTHWTAAGFGYMVSIAVSPNKAQLFAVLVVLVSLMFGGMNPRFEQLQSIVGGVLYYPSYVSMIRWSQEAYYLNEIQYYQNVYPDIQSGMDLFQYDLSHYATDFIMIFVIGVLGRLIGYICLEFMNRDKRK
eukprot:g50285.t1